MKVGLLVLLTAALGALAAHFLLVDNGYVMINFRGYLVEMSVPILLAALVVLYVGVRALVLTWRAPRRLGEAVARRRTRKAGERITQGFIELGQGNFARGERLLTKGIRKSETPLLNYLAAARAAQAQGDTKRRDNWLAMAARQEPRAATTVLMTQAQLQVDAGDNKGAAATLDRVLEASPAHAEALRLRAELCVAAEEWSLLRRLLPRLRSAGTLPAAQLDEWTVQTWSALFAQPDIDAATCQSLWKALPRNLRAQPRLVEAHARALQASGDPKVEALLRKALKQQWDHGLVRMYGELEGTRPAKLLKHAEAWLRHHPDDPALLQTAARLCVREELWGKARSYYESAVALHPTPELWHELGQLMLSMGEQEAAFEAFQNGLTQGYGDRQVLRLPGVHLEADVGPPDASLADSDDPEAPASANAGSAQPG